MINKKIINNLPSTIGVYLFKKNQEILYIGKSVNIKARIKSHIENAKLNKKEYLIVNQADNIETIAVETEFQALLLESELIKKYRPKYNVIWKDDKSYLYITITINDEYPKIFLVRKHDIKENNKKALYFGPFSSTKIAENLISEIRKIIPFCTEKKLSNKPCFYSKIGLCHPCPNIIENTKDKEVKKQLKRQYKNNIKKIIDIFNGKITRILDDFYKKLKKLTSEENYEKAIEIRDKIFRLEKLLNNPIQEEEIINDDHKSLILLLSELKKYFPQIKKLSRIECYDISNLQNQFQVASMVVMTEGKIDKKEYKRFKIKNHNLSSDFERIKEVLERRFKNDWPLPDLLVIDGGRPQVKIVLEILKNFNKDIPVIGIAKNPDRLIIGQENFLTVKFPQTHKGFNLIRLLRDEAHRFAKKYHLKIRNKNFLI